MSDPEEQFLWNDEWLNEEQFQGWLVKVSNDERRAYCRFCALVLQARRTDLTAHLRAQPHVVNTKAAAEAGIVSGPISVQIVCNENDNEEEQEGDFAPVAAGEEEVGGEVLTDYKPDLSGQGQGQGTRRSSGKHYIKKYRPAWEDEEEFRDWLQPYPEDVQRAFCKACKTILRAHKHDLTCHARTTRHQKKIQELKAEQGGEHLFQMIAEDVVTSKRALEEAVGVGVGVGEIGIEIDTSGIFPDTGDSGSGSGGREDGGGNKSNKVGKMSKDMLRRGESINSIAKQQQRKKVRFTATDVVTAIENNEFTGYELLQIVKKAVPKL